jgi:hypothetical protein
MATMAEPIDPALARKLDAFTVPPLPGDFAERLAQKAAAMPPDASSAAPLPPLRRSAPVRRWRIATTGLGAVALGMMSISAAAMGYFGEPLREAVQKAPVVGPAIVTAIERVAPERFAARLAPAPKPEELARQVSPTEAPELQDRESAPPRLLDRVARRRIMADPEARRAWMDAHPRAAERIGERQAARRDWLEAHPRAAEMVEERRAAREAGASPREMRQLRREQIREAREQRGELRAVPQAQAPAAPPAARTIEQPSAPPADQPAADVSTVPDNEAGADMAQNRLERRERRQERRERLRQRMERLRP